MLHQNAGNCLPIVTTLTSLSSQTAVFSSALLREPSISHRQLSVGKRSVPCSKMFHWLLLFKNSTVFKQQQKFTKTMQLRTMRPISCHSLVKWSGVVLTSERYWHYSVWVDRDQRCKTYLHYRGVKDSGNREKSYAWRSERKVHAARLLLSHCYDVMISDQSTSNTEFSFQVLSYLWHSLISVRILGLSIFTATNAGKWISINHPDH